MELSFIKTQAGMQPANPEAEKFYKKLKPGEIVSGEFKKKRNPQFHAKFFAMLNFAFEYWQPGEINSEYGTPERNFDRFRKDLIILAGFYHTVIRLDGSVRTEAQSISFAKMDQREFERVYNAVFNVIMDRIFRGYEAEQVQEMIEQFMGDNSP